jgi:hypothetical protein
MRDDMNAAHTHIEKSACADNWTPIAGYEGLYRVSEAAQVFNITARAIVTPAIMRGHVSVTLYSRAGVKETLLLARLVLTSFDGPPPYRGARIVFKNGRPHDCRLSNLAWAQPQPSSPPSFMILGTMGGRSRWLEAQAGQARILVTMTARRMSAGAGR